MNESVSPFEVVACASSAGGIKVLLSILKELPSNFPAPILVVQHLDPNRRSLLVGILSRSCSLHVKQAEDGELVEPGYVYVAPPNFHLLVRRNHHLTLTVTKPVQFVRPSADLLFESVAECYGPRAIAVVLSGMGSDGARGICAIKRSRGTVIVQDSAAFSGMPRAAIATGMADYVLPQDEIPGVLMTLMVQPS